MLVDYERRLHQRMDKHSDDIDHLNESIHGNGVPGLKTDVHAIKLAVDRLEKAEAVRFEDARFVRRAIFAGVIIHSIVFIMGLAWIGMKMSLGGA